MSVPTEFEASYADFKLYPEKLVSRSLYGASSLSLYRKKFAQRQPTLCVTNDKLIKVPVRDIRKDGSVSKVNIFTLSDLKDWVGDETSADPLNPNNTLGQLVTKVDPGCRFIFLVSGSQTAKLWISADMLCGILTWHQVMPAFLDFLYVYGNPYGQDREVRYGGFRSEQVLNGPHRGNVIDSLHRTGRRYQMCYNIKAVALKHTTEGEIVDKTWKIRQAVIHHQFDVGSWTQLWIFGDPHLDLKERVGSSFPEYEKFSQEFGTLERSFQSSLGVHIVCCRWAGEEWRDHIQSLEEIVDRLTVYVLGYGRGLEDMKWNAGAAGDIHQYEGLTNDAIMALESNAEIMKRLQTFYAVLVEDDDFPNTSRPTCRKMAKTFATQMDELIYDMKMQIARAKALSRVASDRKDILIQHLQAQAAKRQEALATVMWEQAEQSARDAVAMKIITVITLFYLPATFASTLFSTDIVKYQDDDEGYVTLNGTERFSPLALYRWLQLTLPLMVTTFLGVYFWNRFEARKSKARQKKLQEKHPDVFDEKERMRG